MKKIKALTALAFVGLVVVLSLVIGGDDQPTSEQMGPASKANQTAMTDGDNRGHDTAGNTGQVSVITLVPATNHLKLQGNTIKPGYRDCILCHGTVFYGR